MCRSVLCALLIVGILPFTLSLYEDQAGKFDWRQQYFGETAFWSLEAITSSNRRVYIGTKSNILASVNLRNGEIVWRRVMEENGKLLEMLHNEKYLITLSSHLGLVLRAWDITVGHSHWEISLSDDVNSTFSIAFYKSSNQVIAIVDSQVFCISLLHGTVEWTKTINVKAVESQISIIESSGNILIVQRTASPTMLFVTELTDYGTEVHFFSKDYPLLDSIKNACKLIMGNKEIMCLNSQGGFLHTLVLQPKAAWVTESLAMFAVNTIKKDQIMKLKVISNTKLLLLSEEPHACILTQQNDKYVMDGKIPKADVYTKIVNEDQTYIVAGSYNSQPFRNFVIRFYTLNGNEVEEYQRTYHIAQHHGKPAKIMGFMFRKKDNFYTYRLLLLTEDHAIHFLQQKGTVMWVREEALAGILAADMVDLPVSENQAKMEEEFGHKERNVFEMFGKRITTQASQFKAFLVSIMRSSRLKATRDALAQHSQLSPEDVEDGSSDSESISPKEDLELTRDEFNLHKIIVAATASGKLFGIDSHTGQHVWKYFLSNVEPFQGNRILLFQQRTNAHFPLPPQCVVIMQSKTSKNGVVLALNPVTGLPVHQTEPILTMPFALSQATLLYYTPNEDHLRPILLLDVKHKVHVYPSNYQLALNHHPVYLFTVDKVTGTVSGYKVTRKPTAEYIGEKVWDLALGSPSQAIVAASTRSPIEHVHSVGRILGDRGVLYKYLNPNILAVITEGLDIASQKNSLMLYLIDVVVGKIVYSVQHKRCGSPVTLVHSENWVVYSFYNQKSYRTEVVVLELYESNSTSTLNVDVNVNTGFDIHAVQNALRSTQQWFRRYVVSVVNHWLESRLNNSSLTAEDDEVPVFSSRSRSSLDLIPHVLKQAYIIASPVRVMGVSLTEKGITAKSVLVALNNGGILELPKAMLDPRRTFDITMELREEGVESYTPELPLNPMAIINYNQSVVRVRGIVTTPSGLESTSLVFVYGLDLFFNRIAPSKMYDVLKEDFDYGFIALVTGGMIVGSFVTQKLAASRALKRAWQ